MSIISFVFLNTDLLKGTIIFVTGISKQETDSANKLRNLL